jgi:sulfur relay (sulfurtransferase) DsrF/TusC family protein
MPKPKALRYGFIITSTSASIKDPGQLLRAALARSKEGAEVGIFLIGDGILIAASDPKGNIATKSLLAAMVAGAKVLVSKDHLEATGLSGERLPKGAKIVEKPYKELVAKVMEEWDRVVVC